MPGGQSQPFQKDDFAAAYAIAKEALGYVGRFKTPPTPEVYEVWYRYTEGGNPAITDHLAHAVGESEEVSQELLEQLHGQFCVPEDGISSSIGSELSSELHNIQSIVADQVTANDHFGTSLDGANEFLGQSMPPKEQIASCVEKIISDNQLMQAQLNQMGSRLQESQVQVKKLQDDLFSSQQSMLTDPLTGIGNRRMFEAMTAKAIQEKNSTSKSSYLFLIDLDEFKSINDMHGHSGGDKVLRYIGMELPQLEPTATVARFGGDEFALLFQSGQQETAKDLGDSIQEFFASTSLKFTQSGKILEGIGLSIGIARLRPEEDRESWMNRADQLLYTAKKSGRGCVRMERSQDLCGNT